jgi:acetyl/propionyl-CoA carboxylase alpha subunit
LQLKVASGEKLQLKQKEISLRGHAIEFRIYAEDPANNFAPARGSLTKLVRPKGEEIREDFGYEQGDTIPLHYDALLSKFMVYGNSRAEALILARKALNEYVLEGVPSTLAFHRWLLFQPAFISAPVDIAFVEREFSKESLTLLDAAAVRDPQHVPGKVERWMHKNTVVEVKHRADGLFLLRPLAPDGSYARAAECRITNSLEAGKAALIEQVLDNTP